MLADTLQEEIQKAMLGSPNLEVFDAAEAVYQKLKARIEELEELTPPSKSV